MSNEERREAAPSLPEEYDRLEVEVRRLLDEVRGYRDRLEVAEGKVAELQATLRDMSSGELDPVRMKESVRKLESQNRDLRRRMLQAQDRVKRLVARFDFLREEM